MGSKSYGLSFQKSSFWPSCLLKPVMSLEGARLKCWSQLTALESPPRRNRRGYPRYSSSDNTILQHWQSFRHDEVQLAEFLP